jgi:Choline dehydrogenase and related flavoproteins
MFGVLDTSFGFLHFIILLFNLSINNYYCFILFIFILFFSAGCVVTNRLTENPDWKVLLLEAGDEENALTDIPETAHYLQFTKFNWNFTTEFQPGACRGTF